MVAGEHLHGTSPRIVSHYAIVIVKIASEPALGYPVPPLAIARGASPAALADLLFLRAREVRFALDLYGAFPVKGLFPGGWAVDR